MSGLCPKCLMQAVQVPDRDAIYCASPVCRWAITGERIVCLSRWRRRLKWWPS